VSWTGRLRGSLSNQPVYPPIESGSLKTWVAVGGSPESVVRAAYYGLPLMLAIIGGSPVRFKPWVDLYHERLQRFNKPTQPVGVHSPGHVAATDEQAKEELFPHYLAMMNRIGAERGWPPHSRADYDVSLHLRGHLFVGSPQQIVDKILFQHEIFHHERFLLQSTGVIQHDRMMRSIELFGTQVAPQLRKALGLAHTSS
jgi:alkanesulfonate monooxygenase SsuD/methylene tetrahydromethanopterin reductase-like flavin-dependent oxidoreductase (luciferase family)